MNNRIFKDKNGLELIVKNRKSAVIFEIDKDKAQSTKDYKFSFQFTSEDFAELLEHIEMVSNNSWSNLTPKEASSWGADYWDYYDREFDNNGYLSISQDMLVIERPVLESERLYQFNKKKMESFIYDFREILSKA